MAGMKALVCEKPGVLAFEERPMPVPEDGEVLVKMLRVGACGTDLHAFKGNQPYFTYPRVLGHELAVEIAEITPAARVEMTKLGVAPGDRTAVLPYLRCGTCVACRSGKPNCCTGLKVLGVHVDGGFQEYLAIPAWNVVPAGKLSLEQLASVECFAIGYHAVRRSAARSGETALVIGAGPIGIGVMHGLRQSGVRVIALDINEKRLEYCARVVKAEHTVNAAITDAEKCVAELTGGDLPAVVFDATGNAASMMKSFAFASNGGRLVFVSLVNAEISFKDPDFHRKELTLMGSRNATHEDFTRVIEGIASGFVDTTGFVSHNCPIGRLPEVFDSWTRPETGAIKAVVEF
jgi:threonine dehydrogenase-like Zn-dependent dehydrogenase